MSTLFQIRHLTRYQYDTPVRRSHNECRTIPATTGRQICLESILTSVPRYRGVLQYRDYFGTLVQAFDVLGEHEGLEVLQTAKVALRPYPELAATGEAVIGDEPVGGPQELDFLLPSPLVVWDDELAALAATLRRSTVQETIGAVVDWIGEELTYERGWTTVDTPLTDVLERRRGVCQDYAQLACGLFRAVGIPARYVSGYFPPKPLEVGQQVTIETHAWVEVHIPTWGWWPVDPTNRGVSLDERHIKVGHGRDYHDVAPLKGVFVGSATQELSVEVQVERLPDWTEDGLNG